MLELYFLDISDMTDEQFNKICGGLSERRSARARGFLNMGDRYLSAGAGYLLDCALKKHGLSEKQAEIFYGANGKPYLKDCNLFYNLSHSGVVAVCAFSDREVGIDIQKSVTPSDALIKKVCSEDEIKYLLSLGEDDKSSAFTRLWTLKESYLKFTGEGITLSPRSLDLNFSHPVRIKRNGEEQEVNFAEYRVCGCAVSVCSRTDEFPTTIEEIKI